ncbi:hypothetical protein [Moraxella lacunata]|uniref:hypothetical protein n=1 Tax=Moraxella lacunata TaxID=477 RepID=UPI003EE25B41
MCQPFPKTKPCLMAGFCFGDIKIRTNQTLKFCHTQNLFVQSLLFGTWFGRL